MSQPRIQFMQPAITTQVILQRANMKVTSTKFSLASNASTTGFYTTTAGEDPDRVYGLIQCRGNITKEDCQTCANNSILEIVRQCLNQKEAIIGYDNCRLWYSDWRFFSTANDIIRVIFLNFQSVPDPDHFRTQLGDLIDNLLAEAASDPSRFATGRTGYNNITDIYGMAQCTRDLTKTSCLSCLKEMVNNIPSCCVSKQGAQVISVSCNIRYEIYSFFQSPPSRPPAPILISAPPPSLEKNSTSSRTITTRSTREDGKRKTSRPVIIVVSTTVSVLVIVSITCSCLLLRKALRKRVDNLAKEEINSRDSLLYDLLTLKAATKNFSDANKLGEGGFGSVYKGKLHDGREIAVKRLSSNSGQGLEELRTEVELVAKLLHRNLARLLGFCLKEHEKLLVYEYLPNGRLDKILFDQRKRLTLGWERRYKIIVGIARGLLYLHEDSQLRIVHRDLKSSNILLDESLNPKISDFGLARLFHGSETQGNTKRIAGTCGYMAPEYAKHGYFSRKSDVFSFGVLVLEIVTDRKTSSFHDSMNLLSYAWQHWDNGTALDLTDPVLGDQVESSEVLKCIHIGLLCVQEAVADRPKISDVALMLSSYSVSSPVPSQPAFFVRAQRAESDLLREYPAINESGRSDMEIVQQSLNGVTVTELDPR